MTWLEKKNHILSPHSGEIWLWLHNLIGMDFATCIWNSPSPLYLTLQMRNRELNHLPHITQLKDIIQCLKMVRSQNSNLLAERPDALELSNSPSSFTHFRSCMNHAELMPWLDSLLRFILTSQGGCKEACTWTAEQEARWSVRMCKKKQERQFDKKFLDWRCVGCRGVHKQKRHRKSTQVEK